MAMSIVSDFNVHPDEEFHIKAANYYRMNSLPPRVGEPDNLESYSIYGKSYNDLLGLDYLFLGKLSELLQSSFLEIDLKISKITATRSVQFFYLIFLISYLVSSYKKISKSYIFINVLFISSQTWYIFSYINNDTLPFVFSSILLFSFLNLSILKLKHSIFLGSIFGFLLISKLNYLPVFIFIFILVIKKLIPDPRKVFHSFKLNSYQNRKILLIVLLGLGIFLIRLGYDTSINGIKKNHKVAIFAEEIADPMFTRKTFEKDKNSAYGGLFLKERDYTLYDLFEKWNWHILTFESFFGLYGYMNIRLPDLLYKLLILNSVLFINICVIIPFIKSIIHKFKVGIYKLIYDILLLILALSPILLSLAHSWINDFQPQGKYLFPMIPLIAYLIYSYKRFLNLKLFSLLIIHYYILSLTGFLFFGLQNIPKNL